jgi:hypothetical protein
MSTENKPTETTAAAPVESAAVEEHIETAEAEADPTAAKPAKKPGQVKPDNWVTD